ncbi:MAG: hypothetical protein GX230_07570 [Lentisphaerae bacterium]|nr:hypothetical protein [Lentisphaerota bacterium]
MKTVNRITSGVAGLALLLVILAAACVVISNLRLRADLTAEKLFTLSSGSRELVGKLDNDVTLKFYFSKSSPSAEIYLKNYAKQVQDLLREYELSSKGRIVLESYDPKPDSDEEEWAQKFGIQAQTMRPYTPPVYFGMVASCNGKEASIPVFSPATEQTLEYEISRLIASVAWPQKPVIAVMSGKLDAMGDNDPMAAMTGRGQQQKPWAVFSELKRDYTVRAIADDTTEIEPDVTTLVLVHPKNLSEKTLFAIDQFVLRGGRLLACLDPFSIQDFRTSQSQNQMMAMGMQNPDGPGPSTLGKLLNAWGVGYDTSKVLADMRAITRLDGGNGRIDENPVVLSFSAANANDKDVLTSRLSQLIFPFAGTFTDNTSPDVEFTPLIFSSDKSSKVDTMAAQYGTSMLRNQLSPDGLQHPVAVRLKGTFKTAFPDGAPQDEDAAEETDSATADSADAPAEYLTSGASAIVLVGDSDFLHDSWTVRTATLFFGYQTTEAINDNITFVVNTAEQLAGRSELIAIRSRGRSARPFKVVEELEQNAMLKWSEQEKALQAKLQETRSRISSLQEQKEAHQRMILSPEQEQAIAKFREEERHTNRELKNLRRNLNADIENLGIRLKVINIALIPALIVITSIARSLIRRR